MWFDILVAALTIGGLLYFLYRFNLSEGKDKKKSPSKNIPGLEPSDPIEGNKKEIEQAGSLTDFLNDMHKKYGPIVRFCEGNKMAVAIATPEMWKQIRHLCEVPLEITESFKLIMGPEVFSFCGIDEIKRRRKVYDHHFMMSACKTYSDNFVDISKELVEKWKKTDGEPISLMKSMARYSLTSILRCCFGEFSKDEKTLDEYQELVDWAFRHINPQPKEGTEEYKTLVEKCNKIHDTAQKVIDERRQQKRSDDESELFIDVLLDMDITEGSRKADVTGFISGGYITAATILTWFFYEMARHPEIQDKIHEEIVLKLGDQTVTVETMPKLTFLRQAIDETLRVYMSSGVTARIAESDMEVGGYGVPLGTTIYMTFDAVFNDSQIWKNPEKFDPSRFSRENSRGRSLFAFKPFGFAGKRMCPGMNFALSEMTIFISECLHHCRLRLVPGQDVKKVLGFTLSPSEEIMITIEKR